MQLLKLAQLRKVKHPVSQYFTLAKFLQLGRASEGFFFLKKLLCVVLYTHTNHFTAYHTAAGLVQEGN